MRSKEATNEYLEYIISSNSSDIDSLNLAKVRHSAKYLKMFLK